jgi:hypothetical protein
VVGTPLAAGVYYCCIVRKTAQRVAENTARPGDHETIARETANNVVATRIVINEVLSQLRRGNDEGAAELERSIHGSNSGRRSVQGSPSRSGSLLEPGSLERAGSLPESQGSQQQRRVRSSHTMSAPLSRVAEPAPGIEGRDDSFSSSSSRQSQSQSQRLRRRREGEGQSEITAQDPDRYDNESPRGVEAAGASTGQDWGRQDPDQVLPAASHFDIESQQRASDPGPVGRIRGGFFSKMTGQSRSRAPPLPLPQNQTPGANQTPDAILSRPRRGSWTDRIIPAIFRSKAGSGQTTSDQRGSRLQSGAAAPDRSIQH